MRKVGLTVGIIVLVVAILAATSVVLAGKPDEDNGTLFHKFDDEGVCMEKYFKQYPSTGQGWVEGPCPEEEPGDDDVPGDDDDVPGDDDDVPGDDDDVPGDDDDKPLPAPVPEPPTTQSGPSLCVDLFGSFLKVVPGQLTWYFVTNAWVDGNLYLSQAEYTLGGTLADEDPYRPGNYSLVICQDVTVMFAVDGQMAAIVRTQNATVTEAFILTDGLLIYKPMAHQ